MRWIRAGVRRYFDPLYIDPGVNISYDILTPGSIYRNGILTLHDILTPPNGTSNGFVCYVQLLNVVYCYKYIIFMKVWVVQNETIIDTQEIIYMILILSYIFPSKYERQTKLCRRLFQGGQNI